MEGYGVILMVSLDENLFPVVGDYYGLLRWILVTLIVGIAEIFLQFYEVIQNCHTALHFIDRLPGRLHT